MNKTYIKNILRDIKSTKGKVASILIMVMLATMVIVGLNLTGPSMRESLDYSLEAYDNPDIKIKSTYPMDYEDEVIVKKDPDIRDLSFIKTIDLEDKDSILRLKSFDEDFKKVSIIKGDSLSKDTDILLDKGLMDTYELGDKLDLSYINEDQKNTNELKNTGFEVVGFVETSDKFMEDMGAVSPLGKKEIAGLAYIKKDNFTKDEFDEINISYAQSQDMDKTSDEYIDFIGAKKASLEEAFRSRPGEVLGSIRDEASDKIGDAEADISDAKDKLSQTERDLEDARIEIEDGFRTYNDQRQRYYDGIASGEADLKRARSELEDGQAKLNQAKIEIESAKASYDNNIGPAKEKLDQSLRELEENEALINAKESEIKAGLEKIDQTYETALKDLETLKYLPVDEGLDLIYYDEHAKEDEDLGPEDAGLVEKEEEAKKINPLYKEKKAELDKKIGEEKAPLLAGLKELKINRDKLNEGWSSYNKGLNEYEAKKNTALAKINTGQAEIDKNQRDINSGWTSYYRGLDELNRSKTQGQAELENAYNKLVDGKREYEEGLKEYEENKPSALDDIKEGEEKISDEKDALLKLRDPEYEIASIFDDEGIDTYYQNSLNMDKLAKVFPLFFYLVAMLVTLTTMKRYIEEQREINGSLKALGYSSKDIAKRFYIYGLIPTIIGAIIGGLLGRYLIVGVIFNAYSTGFSVLDMVLSDSFLLIIGAILLSSFLVALTVFISSRDTVRESPARLLQGKAPIEGSKILLERISPLWKRLSFMQKITARNLFRYKSRMFMTLFGVAGCTALIFFGFAMIDSLKDTAYIQKNEIHHYNALAVLDERADDEDKKSYERAIDKDKRLGIQNESASLKKDGKTIDLSVVVPEDVDKFDDFVNLRRKKGEPIDLDKAGAVLTENASKTLGLDKGDMIKIDIKGKVLDIEIGAIGENYVSDYLYVSRDLYEDLAGDGLSVNANYIKEDPEKIEDRLKNEDAVLALVNTEGAYESMDSLLDNLNLVIVVITLVSSILASVVLYNITDVNVSERKRELATIKVLGFYPKEVTAYIYREILILTLMGIVLGFGLGYLIFAYITSVVAPRNIMLSLKLHPLSFIVSAAITLALSLIMLIYVHQKLKKIDMAEAMSSGD